MKPAAFDYLRPDSLDEIVATLERGRKAALASMPGTEQLSARP